MACLPGLARSARVILRAFCAGVAGGPGGRASMGTPLPEIGAIGRGPGGTTPGPPGVWPGPISVSPIPAAQSIVWALVCACGVERGRVRIHCGSGPPEGAVGVATTGRAVPPVSWWMPSRSGPVRVCSYMRAPLKRS